MKARRTSAKFSAIFFTALFVGLAPTVIVGEVGQHSFDSLFPKTWYTKATESCAQVWGAFDDLIVHPGTSSIDRSIIIDAAIGRLIFAQFCLDLMVGSQEQPASPDDIAYLSRVIALIDERYGKLVGTLEQDRAYCLRQVINDLQKKLFLLQSKNTFLSSYHQEPRCPNLLYPENTINSIQCWMMDNIWLHNIPVAYLKR